MNQLRYRQVHLDFHTSEYIPNVGSEFDPEEFAKKLEEANVDSITCFARCHHGWLYYPSIKDKELIHPELKRPNLLLEQIEACHKRNIHTPIYTTVQWDARIMREKPEWLSIDENNQFINTQNIPDPHFYHTICLNSEYRAFFKEHLQDIIDVVGAENIDGFFMDILFQVDCNCKHCKKKMKEKNMDSSIKRERLRYSLMMLWEFKTEITAFLKERVPNGSIFYNSSHVGPASKDNFKEYTHLELESLPSGGWGYDHFPATSRYARTLGMDMIGMTGKFHTYWGDFHSLKNRAALEFECYHMLAMGAGCSIGDQLHPGGALSEGSYELIGQVYQGVKEKEPYCYQADSVAEIAVLTPEEFYPEEEYDLGISPSLIGAVRMLQELSYQFDIVDSRADLNKYSLIILPDVIFYNETLEATIKAYIAQGGKVIGSFDSCLDKEKAVNIYGITYIGESPYEREFVMPNDTIGKSIPKEEHVMYTKGYDIEAKEAVVLMDKIKPYFNREGKTFCSHQHAPSSKIKGYPEVTQYGNTLYFAHPIFALYRKNAASWCKQMVKDALELCITDKLVAHNGPSTIITARNRQVDQQRDILHMMHYITEKRSQDIYTIEDCIPLHNIAMKLFVGETVVKEVVQISNNQSIPFIIERGYISFVIEQFVGHDLFCITY